VSVFANAAPLALLVALTGIAATSGMVLVKSVQEEDAGAAWIWAASFILASILAAVSFWRLA
jgi:hypothetical protein